MQSEDFPPSADFDNSNDCSCFTHFARGMCFYGQNKLKNVF